MNYCTKCQSIYSQPGTCNCYAPAQVAPYIQQPVMPWTIPTTVPGITPWNPPLWGGPWWTTITGGGFTSISGTHSQ
jgi:hypothetical protein